MTTADTNVTLPTLHSLTPSHILSLSVLVTSANLLINFTSSLSRDFLNFSLLLVLLLSLAAVHFLDRTLIFTDFVRAYPLWKFLARFCCSSVVV
ncbi:hypothetical protein L6452_11868 [Arctium lappa]|uniref:Uncharacterized protein n=1 Tax=Arctium lappa TaxID=4217 RepID=A0ACB9DQ96_ARCLA|nr:hypothetical protein L6452_11868 [Arctium lappa]